MINSSRFFERLNKQQAENWVRAIDSKLIFSWIDDLFFLLFPEKILEVDEIKALWNRSQIDFDVLISKICTEKTDKEIAEIVETFYAVIPSIYDSLQKDASAIFNTDPAADSISEIINSYCFI